MFFGNIIYEATNQIFPILGNIYYEATRMRPYVQVSTQFPIRVTGGQMDKIGSSYYLAFGQDCEGAPQPSGCATSQVYNNSIYQFNLNFDLSSLDIVNQVTHADSPGSGWRRRDFTLAPYSVNGVDYLLALAGPFTPGTDAFVWTNAISFNAELASQDNFVSNQRANQYLAPTVSMFSSSQQMSYIYTFGGLSNLYWSTSGLVYDNSTPYGNILDVITIDERGVSQEYANLSPL